MSVFVLEAMTIYVTIFCCFIVCLSEVTITVQVCRTTECSKTILFIQLTSHKNVIENMLVLFSSGVKTNYTVTDKVQDSFQSAIIMQEDTSKHRVLVQRSLCLWKNYCLNQYSEQESYPTFINRATAGWFAFMSCSGYQAL